MQTSRGDGSYTHGNSFANGPDGAVAVTGIFKVLGWEYAMAKSVSTTIYDLGALAYCEHHGGGHTCRPMRQRK